MFTGIVQQLGQVERPPGRDGGTLVVRLGRAFEDLQVGESISVNGACVTCTSGEETLLRFDVVGETAHLSNLGLLRSGDLVNLERAPRAGDRFGGHYVLGHVDCMGTVRRTGMRGNQCEVAVSFPERFAPYAVPKGSIAVNGVSLTIASLAGGVFSVALIPYTLQHTNLGRVRRGDRVNLEFDYFGKFVLNFHKKEDLRELLDRAGFTERPWSE